MEHELREGRETDLYSVKFLFCSVPLVSEADDGSGALPDRHPLASAILLQQTLRALTTRGGLSATALGIGLLAAGRAGRALARELGAVSEELLEGELVSTGV